MVVSPPPSSKKPASNAGTGLVGGIVAARPTWPNRGRAGRGFSLHGPNTASTALVAPRFFVQSPQFGQLFADADFEPAFGRLVEVRRLHVVGEVAHAGRKAALLVVRVAVALAVIELLHQLRRGVAQVQRH